MSDQKPMTLKVDQAPCTGDAQSKYSESTRRLAALACNSYKKDGFDINASIAEIEHGLKALGATQGLQEMIASQMLSVHHLQQMSMALANASEYDKNRQYYINAAVKLANCFTQQATLLAKLQGNGGQKIIVEHVEVHNGGQAVVGNVQRGS